MIRDIHAHLFHPSWYPEPFQKAVQKDIVDRLLASGRPQRDAAVAKLVPRMMADRSGDTTLRIMDKVGIDQRVLLVLDWGVELGEAELPIEQIHQEVLAVCRAHPDRFIGFAGVDPRRPNAKEIVSTAVNDLGACGLKFHPTGGWSLLDDATLEVVSVVSERGFPTLVHIGKTVDILTDENAQPDALAALARTFPGSPFIAGHAGFDLWTRFVEMEDCPPNLYFDISGWQERVEGDGQNVLDDLAKLFEVFPGRVFFGTDAPFYGFNLESAERQWYDLICEPNKGSWAGECDRWEDVFCGAAAAG